VKFERKREKKNARHEKKTAHEAATSWVTSPRRTREEPLRSAFVLGLTKTKSHNNNNNNNNNNNKPATMKVISALALATLAVSSPITAAASADSVPATKASSSLRGSTATSEEAASESAASSSSGLHRMLQRPDETCWAVGDQTGNNDQIPCTQDVLNSCNNVPACAASEQDAISFGSTWCNIWTVWNNEESDCQWQYMCC
jgi:hypothetical protein